MSRSAIVPASLLAFVLLAAAAIALLTAPAMALAADRSAQWTPSQLAIGPS